MYEELVKRLRHDSESRALMLEAADAIEKRDKYALTIQHEMMAEAESHIALVERLNGEIEELSRMEQDFRQYISDQVNREKGVYACCYCKHRESTNKYEPGCTLEKCDGVSGWAWGVPKEEE